jgi:prepilin-type N-terminal cleavage/methylation domain-containing protein
MPRSRGFTLIELVTVLAIVAILAAAAAVTVGSATRNANLSSATYDFVVRLGGLRATAMSEGQDYLIVFADAPSSDASACGVFNDAGCTRYFVLANPTTTWTLAAFDPESPATNAAFVDEESFPRGVHLDVGQTFTAPPPFSGITLHDSDLRVSCGATQTCFAFRFTRLGSVEPEYAGATKPAKVGYGFVLGTDLSGGGGDRRGIAVAFPSGIVKTVTF